jgi:hypothetical protein
VEVVVRESRPSKMHVRACVVLVTDGACVNP